MNFQNIAEHLFHSDLNKQTTTMLTSQYPNFDIPAGYSVQALLKELHLANGSKIVGMKMGLTSKAKMQQMNVNEPIFGFLTDKMLVKNNSTIALSNQIHPKIEPEIALILKNEVSSELSYNQALQAIDYATTALEIIDSRFENFKFLLPDVIADNTSATKFVLGDSKILVTEGSLANLPILMKINGTLAEQGNTSDVLLDPVNSLCELSKMLANHNIILNSGDCILTGGATAAVKVESGFQVNCSVQGFDDCIANFI